MNREQLIEAGRNVIANGVGCDLYCQTDEGKQHPCGCREDACRIIAMTVNAAANVCYNMNNRWASDEAINCGDEIHKELTP